MAKGWLPRAHFHQPKDALVEPLQAESQAKSCLERINAAEKKSPESPGPAGMAQLVFQHGDIGDHCG